MRIVGAMLGLAVAATVAHAQAVTAPSELPPLAELRDEKQLAQALATITQDPALRVTDPKARPLATALMAEGVRQLLAERYEQALANFLEAYDKLPSPKILLNIGSTLRDMGRLADAANTYQRYLSDPATGPERVEEVKKLLVEMDQQLTLLTVRVQPKGSDVSIDGGPFITVGTALVARVRPGLHLVRVRKGTASAELTVNGFEAESKEVTATVAEPAAQPQPKPDPQQPKPDPQTPGVDPKPLPTVRTPEAPPEQHFGWLDTSTQYGTSDPTSTKREVHSGYAGPAVRPILRDAPAGEIDDYVYVPPPPERGHHISPGVLGIMRIDGKGRGIAGGLGIAGSPTPAIEVELAVLRSNQWGGFAGIRFRLLTGSVRPYVGGGFPVFTFEDENAGMKRKVAFGMRGSAGIEVRINGHLSLQGDVGLEYFLVDTDALIDGKHPEEKVFVPTLGVIGRL
jgi:hypothetical protein